jgi:hypothetical protein
VLAGSTTKSKRVRPHAMIMHPLSLSNWNGGVAILKGHGPSHTLGGRGRNDQLRPEAGLLPFRASPSARYPALAGLELDASFPPPQRQASRRSVGKAGFFKRARLFFAAFWESLIDPNYEAQLKAAPPVQVTTSSY